jgi:hypothetical protein
MGSIRSALLVEVVGIRSMQILDSHDLIALVEVLESLM